MLKRKFSFLFALTLLFGSLQIVNAFGTCPCCRNNIYSPKVDGAVGAGAWCSSQGAPDCKPGYQVTNTQQCQFGGTVYIVTAGGGGGGGGGLYVFNIEIVHKEKRYTLN